MREFLRRSLQVTTHLVVVIGVTTPLAAQQQRQQHAQHAAKPGEGGRFPAGWRARLDQADARVDEVVFSPLTGGFHAVTGPAAILYHPTNVARGSFTVEGEFSQQPHESRREAYGLFFGGSALDSPEQTYYYFLVRQDGRYMIRHRKGNDVNTIADWTEHPAIKQSAGGARLTNRLTVAVAADSVRFSINGTPALAVAKGALPSTDGQTGLRINHGLDVEVRGFVVK